MNSSVVLAETRLILRLHRATCTKLISLSPCSQRAHSDNWSHSWTANNRSYSTTGSFSKAIYYFSYHTSNSVNISTGNNICYPNSSYPDNNNQEDFNKAVVADNSDNSVMNLSTVISRLNNFAATSLAESWDNVGLLVEPSPPFEVTNLMITNDLTELVLEEAIEKNINLILSYHPPIFVPLKSLTQRTAKERIIVKCLERRIAIFSPHTSYDAVENGVNDWLISPFVAEGSKVEPLHPVTSKCYATPGRYRVDVIFPIEDTEKIYDQLNCIDGVSQVFRLTVVNTTKFTMNCTDRGLERIVAYVNSSSSEMAQQSVEIITLDKPPIPNHGMGRKCKRKQPITLENAVAMVKQHLQLDHVRLAIGEKCALDSPIKSIAVCAGSGSSVLKGVKVNMYVTGEMSHHDVLDATSRGISVILCDHTNTERGYLHSLKDKFTELFDNKVTIHLSSTDTDPLKIV
ncbi:unnamed protein product [Owenia fusiformis]|uniref:NIF3-like protein 1 n=1 Tax=Owenia fusiformis TaxID=6347 RepID=A0A8S4Q525_OWEFU|nr:unnamed protein product [Owenia fusiformis]